MSSSSLKSDRTYAADDGWGDEDVIEVQIFEDGGLRLFMPRLSDGISSRGSENEEEQVLFDAGAVILTRHMLELTRLVSDDVGYHGNWAVAVGANRLRGRRRHTGQSHFPSNHRYSADTYEECTGATMAELRDAPGTVTRRLPGPLLRSLDSEELFAKALTDEGVSLAPRDATGLGGSAMTAPGTGSGAASSNDAATPPSRRGRLRSPGQRSGALHCGPVVSAVVYGHRVPVRGRCALAWPYGWPGESGVARFPPLTGWHGSGPFRMEGRHQRRHVLLTSLWRAIARRSGNFHPSARLLAFLFAGVLAGRRDGGR
ncbi:hypothetical protein [Streptomyces pseudogriseolus]|uniref:hypothetical protein n=1 Tax=Streptomyces pseudogriseolus TaxID=36817 RepID=UPI003FA24418